MSLYTFDNDYFNSSTCLGTPEDTEICAGKWPPLLADDGAIANGLMTIFNRDTGDNQWAYKGLPLYFLASDNNIGDIGGLYLDLS